MSEARRLIDRMHVYTNQIGDGYRYLLERLEAENDSGWSPGAMPMIDMVNDAKTLRKLADRIEGQRRRMLVEQRHLQAAE